MYPYITWFTGEGAGGVICEDNGYCLTLGISRQPCDILDVANLSHLGNRLKVKMVKCQLLFDLWSYEISVQYAFENCDTS